MEQRSRTERHCRTTTLRISDRKEEMKFRNIDERIAALVDIGNSGVPVTNEYLEEYERTRMNHEHDR